MDFGKQQKEMTNNNSITLEEQINKIKKSLKELKKRSKILAKKSAKLSK